MSGKRRRFRQSVQKIVGGWRDVGYANFFSFSTGSRSYVNCLPKIEVDRREIPYSLAQFRYERPQREDLADLFEQSAAERNPDPRDRRGGPCGVRREAFLQNYSEGQWINKERNGWPMPSNTQPEKALERGEEFLTRRNRLSQRLVDAYVAASGPVTYGPLRKAVSTSVAADNGHVIERGKPHRTAQWLWADAQNRSFQKVRLPTELSRI